MAHDLAGSSIGASRSALSPPDARVHLFHRSVSISNRIHFGSRLRRKSGKQHLMAGTKDVCAGSRIHSEASVNVASTQLCHGRFLSLICLRNLFFFWIQSIGFLGIIFMLSQLFQGLADAQCISMFDIGFTRLLVKRFPSSEPSSSLQQ